MQNCTYSVVEPDSELPAPEGVELTQMVHPFAPREWVCGHGPKFGLVVTDRVTFARMPRAGERHRQGLAR